ncbi:MAG: ABC transporter substrate-binding protein [Planctomycetes bacterium]|nr:ABC transporter substrate-binding protein [Planctomycetota bacterium]
MRQNPLWNALLTFINVAAVAFAVYIAVDALDITRRQSARIDQSLNRLSDSLERLSISIANLETPAPRQDGTAASAGRSTPARNGQADGVFANDEFRDPLAEDGGEMVTRAISFPGNLNNIITNEATVSTFWDLVIDPLGRRNRNDLTKYEPMLAESWEVSEDGLEYLIHLRRNALWQPYIDPVTKEQVAAKPVTSRDFLFYWNTLQNTQIPADPLRTYLELMDRIEVVDDYTFKVVWKEPYSLGEEITMSLTPLPEHYYRPDSSWDDDRFAQEFIASPRNQWIVGIGPYKLARWDKNTEAVFERDENYYAPKPSIKTRRIRIYPDSTLAFLDFQRDQIDSIGLSPQQWHEETPEPLFQTVTSNVATAYEDSLEWDRRKKAGELPDDYQYEKFEYPGQSWAYIGWNLQRPMFQDRQVRVALSHLVDKERILDEVFMGLGSIISGPFIPRSPYYNHQVKPIPFDIEEAGRLLAEAGWEDTDGDGILDKDYDNSGIRKPFTFSLMIPANSPLIRQWSSIIEQDMIKAKIKMDIKPIEWSVYTQSLDQRSFDACTLFWTGGVEGDPYQIWHGAGASREASSNFISYNSPEANRLIDEGRRTVDKQKRYAIYQRLHEVIAEDQPYTFLVSGAVTVARNKRFYNAIVYRGGEMDANLQWIPQSMQVVR